MGRDIEGERILPAAGVRALRLQSLPTAAQVLDLDEDPRRSALAQGRRGGPAGHLHPAFGIDGHVQEDAIGQGLVDRPRLAAGQGRSDRRDDLVRPSRVRPLQLGQDRLDLGPQRAVAGLRGGRGEPSDGQADQRRVNDHARASETVSSTTPGPAGPIGLLTCATSVISPRLPEGETACRMRHEKDPGNTGCRDGTTPSHLSTPRGPNDMDRRGFLKQGAVAALAASASTSAGPFIHAADKSGAKAPIVGEGEHRYECRHDFFQAPGSIRWFETHGVAVDSQGFIYVTHRGGATKPKSPAEAQDTIAVYDPEGKFVRSFGKAFHGGGHGIDVRVEDGVEYLYLACMMPVDLVAKTDLKGEVVWIKEAPPEPHVYDKPDAKFAPTNVAFAPDGGFFVADGYGSHYIH
ncbi:hypothetical protein HK102_011685, partial [Quaeritorhiza haematococci]